jgi:putative transcriptional regulator
MGSNMSLKEFREASGLSQKQLAAASGVSQQLISHIETGQRSPAELGLDRARAIVSALATAGADCELDDVFPPGRAVA